MNLKRHSTFLRFLIAGGVNTLLGWIVYSAAILACAQPWLALIVSTVTGISFNFISMGTYAFRDMALQRIPRFVLSYGFIYATNLACLKWLKPWVDHPIWAQLLMTPALAILSYLLLSRLVFTGNKITT